MADIGELRRQLTAVIELGEQANKLITQGVADYVVVLSHLRGIVNHWDEFGSEYGFEERIDHARQFLGDPVRD